VIAVVEPQPKQAQDWYAQLLLQNFQRHRPMRTLVISGSPGELATAGVSAPCCVRIARGGEYRWHVVETSRLALPFQVDVFDFVVLHNCVAQGDVRALAAVRRAMPGGAQLLVMGSGWFNPRRLRKRGRTSRAFRPGWLRSRMEQLGFMPRGASGRGVAGLDLELDHGIGRFLQPCGDQLAIRARRREGRPDIRLVRFSTPRSVVGPAAAWEGANRDYPE
jgi:SAM-dependent methyltransferase